jgi:anti-sigma B factor antagonist
MSGPDLKSCEPAATDRSPATGAVSPAPFRLIESPIGPDRREIKVEGELDLAVAGQLEEALARAAGDDVVLDLSGCEFIGTSGLAVIVNARRDAGGSLVVHSPRDQVLRILDLTGLSADGLVYENREQAIAQGTRALG